MPIDLGRWTILKRRREANCPSCGRPVPRAELNEAFWYPFWERKDGACPACVQKNLLRALLEHGEGALDEGVQSSWPLDAEATREPVRVLRFSPQRRPVWPKWHAGADWQWHGLMTSVVAAGNGRLSHGLYAGLASEANLVLIQGRDENGRITNSTIIRALEWLRREGSGLGVRVVSLSVGGDPVETLRGNPVDEAAEALVEAGITVVAAAGNAGERRLLPPAT